MHLRLSALNLMKSIGKGLHLLLVAFLLQYAIFNLLFLLEIKRSVLYIQEPFDVAKVEARGIFTFVEIG